jgi:ATP-dependent Clp protease ATP-binding subunit ClpX
MIKLKRLRCSFCRKDETQVAKLVAGPRVYICDQCVTIASRIMEGADIGNQPRW